MTEDEQEAFGDLIRQLHVASFNQHGPEALFRTAFDAEAQLEDLVRRIHPEAREHSSTTWLRRGHELARIALATVLDETVNGGGFDLGPRLLRTVHDCLENHRSGAWR